MLGGVTGSVVSVWCSVSRLWEGENILVFELSGGAGIQNPRRDNRSQRVGGEIWFETIVWIGWHKGRELSGNVGWGKQGE